MARASLPAEDFSYDPLGRRIEKTVTDQSGSVTTRYGYNGERVIEEFALDGTLQAEFVYGTYLDEVVLMVRGGQGLYFHADDQYNVDKVTNASGDVVETYDYGDYGAPEFYDAAGTPLPASTIGNSFLFTGRQWDNESGLYYFRARYLDPREGRFTTRDPLGIWGDLANLGNGYTYAANNPWSLVDPFGLEADRLQTWEEMLQEAVDNGEPLPHDLLLEVMADIAESPEAAFIASLFTDGELGLELAALIWPAADLVIAEQAFARGDVLGGILGLAGMIPFFGDGIRHGGDLIADQILNATRTGRALASDPYHRAASFLTREQLQSGQTSLILGGDGTGYLLHQVTGEFDGKQGVFEYILDSQGNVTHQLFRPDN